METKRCVLYIIRVQTGANLMEIMVKPPTEEDEERWMTLAGQADHLLGGILKTVKGVQRKPTLSNLYQSA